MDIFAIVSIKKNRVTRVFDNLSDLEEGARVAVACRNSCDDAFVLHAENIGVSDHLKLLNDPLCARAYVADAQKRTKNGTVPDTEIAAVKFYPAQELVCESD